MQRKKMIRKRVAKDPITVANKKRQFKENDGFAPVPDEDEDLPFK